MNVVVTNTDDSGAGSLRQAIADVAPGGTITFSALFNRTEGLETINLTSGQLTIAKSLSIVGPGANMLNVRRNSDNLFRIFGIVAPGINVTLSGMTISNGRLTDNGGGIVNSLSTANLTVSNCVITENQANGGGGIYNLGVLTVTGTTISNNTANFDGGGIYGIDGAATTVSNSTISGNQAGSGTGAGIHHLAVVGSATLQINNSTIANNTSSAPGGGLTIRTQVGGGTIAATLRSTIIANNTAPNLLTVVASGGGAATITSQGFNLTNDPTGAFLNQQTDLFNVDPRLGPLSDNGGPTRTHALLVGSPAIDQGNSGGLTNDQRGIGFLRVIDLPTGNAPGSDGTDIGAYERAVVTIAGRVTTPSGNVLRNVVVSLIDTQGVRVTATTGSFGRFTFADVATGQTYILGVSTKRYRFAPQTLQNVIGSLDVGDLVGLE